MQVWVNNRLVGDLAVVPSPRANVHIVQQMQGLPLPIPGSFDDEDLLEKPQIDRIEIPLRWRHAAFDTMLIDTSRVGLPDMMRAAHIPADAEMSRDPMDPQLRFKWRVFDVSPAVYQAIFDLPAFEPV